MDESARSARAFVLTGLQYLGLSRRLLLYTLLVAAVPVALIAFFAVQAGGDGIEYRSNLRLSSIVFLKAQEIDRWARQLEAVAVALSTSPQVQEAVETLVAEDTNMEEIGAARESLEAYFRNSLISHDIEEISVISADRHVVIGSSSGLLVGELDNLGFSVTGLSQPLVYVSPYGPNPESGNAAVAAPVPQRGTVLAYLVIRASPGALYRALASDDLSLLGGNVYLVNASGEVLTPLEDVPPNTGAVRAFGALGQSVGQFESGLHYKDFYGNDVVGAFAPLDALGWGVVAEVPSDQATGDLNRIRIIIGTASAGFFVLIVMAATLISRRMSEPVLQLAAGAQEIGSGNLSHRIHVNSQDELAMLAESFNQMASDLEMAQRLTVEAEKAAALQSFAERKVEQLKSLSRLGLHVATEQSIESLVEQTAEMASQCATSDLSAVALFSEDEARIEHLGHTGPRDAGLMDHLLQDKALWDRLIGGHSVVHSAAAFDGWGDCGTVGCPESTHALRAVLTVPTHGDDGSVTGVVILANLSSDADFSEEDRELLHIIAGYVSAALQKIRKQTRLQSSEQKALEAVEELKTAQGQLVQMQKMESIGRLAGGVAHDFNNLLTPIMGYAQLGVRSVGPGQERLKANLMEIQNAAERASNLTRQLLAFSRPQMVEPKVINLNDLMFDLDKMLRRLIGEDVELVIVPGSGLGSLRTNEGQLEQVIMNLVINARDAMPTGGRLVIATDNFSVDEEFARSTPLLGRGDYVLLTVSDTGSGMSPEIQARIFEPFFTTKQEGKGTGLGLATCYGIVQQNQGHIAVESELGQGTSFKVYMPRVTEHADTVDLSDDADASAPGTETVLLAEDESMVRDLTARVLEERGYTVHQASNGTEALRAVSGLNGQKIDLLVTDVIMPLMGGKELAEKMREVYPDIRVLFMSGYTDDVITGTEPLGPGTSFAQKPFLPVTLAKKVRDLLDGYESPVVELEAQDQAAG